ncbi:hypothetical protein ElyMa_003444300 [Elysia marginata]|uniref:Uncharacterized protein n=1 Tax=Elysia marginata TaxID=1093978 RepID=A0AAV4JRZ6_9GAST|nr:hypothetical protein ElyMa_003444300 [Elysia marginata]
MQVSFATPKGYFIDRTRSPKILTPLAEPSFFQRLAGSWFSCYKKLRVNKGVRPWVAAILKPGPRNTTKMLISDDYGWDSGNWKVKA